ncbi:hypothetical protein WDU94_003399 [Cyamophila willieti]
MNQEKFNIFLQLLNNFVNNKNINTIIKDSGQNSRVIHELLLIKIVRIVNNKHRVILFNMVNELISSIQSVKMKLVNNDSRKLNNASETNSYHHVHILGHSYSLLNNNKCIISNLNLIMISFLGVSNEDKQEKVPSCDRMSDSSGANGSCMRSPGKDLDRNDLNVHIVKLLLNNGACCCFPHKILFNKIHCLLETSEGNKKMITHCFMLLENMLYKELNYYSGCSPCKYCDLVFVENTSKMESNTSPTKQQEKNNADSNKTAPNEQSKPSSKFTITNILSRSNSNKNNSNERKGSKNTNITSTTSGNNTSSTCNEEKTSRAPPQDRAKPSPDISTTSVKQSSSIDEELLIGFYKSIIQSDHYKLKYKLLQHLIRVINLFKSNLQLDLIEQLIYPLFVKLKHQLSGSKFVPKEFLVVTEKSVNNEEDLNEFIIVDKDLNIISSDKLDFNNQIEQSTPTKDEATATPPSAGQNEGATSDTQPGKKVIKRRRSRKNSSEQNKQNNVPPQRSTDSKKKLTPKNSKEKLTPTQSNRGGGSSKQNSPNEKTGQDICDNNRLEAELKQLNCAKTSDESLDKLKNINSNQNKDVYKASIEQTLESFEQSKNAALVTETDVGKSEQDQDNVHETNVENIEEFTDDAKTYEQNLNLMIQVLILVQNLTKQNKNVAKLLKKNNVHECLNDIHLIDNLTKLVCNILENFLVLSVDKKKQPTALGYAEEFNLLMNYVRHIGVKLLNIINSTDDNLMDTIIFQTKLHQDVYLYCITLLNALVKSVNNVLERFPSLSTVETVRFLGDLYDSINSVIVRYVFVEEFPQYKDFNHKSLELKLLETFIVFRTLCQVKKLSNKGSDEQGENVSAKEEMQDEDQSRLKRTLVTGINRRHFNLKQVWDMLIKCSIQSVSPQHSVKMYQQYPTVLAYSSDCE